MRDWLRKAWAWLKRNWKWVIFPVGILLAILTAITSMALVRQYAEPPNDLDEKTREALKKLRQADVVRDQKIAELEVRRHEQLKQLSEEQQAELKELNGKSLDEVVAWFDNL